MLFKSWLASTREGGSNHPPTPKETENLVMKDTDFVDNEQILNKKKDTDGTTEIQM